MEKIQHSYLNINGLKLHVAHVGRGASGNVVFLHGFPEIWYSWRHQMLAITEAGFRAIALDWRGYGFSEQPPEPEKASSADLVADILAMLDILSITKAFIVAKDFGIKPAYEFALLHTDRVGGIISLGAPYSPRPFTADELLPKGFYVLRMREPGRAEKDFSRFDVKTVVRNIYLLFCKSELQIAKDDQEIMDLIEPFAPLPHWFSEEDLEIYAASYENSGFTYPLQMPYRSIRKASVINDPIVKAPAMLIMGEKDYALKLPGMEEFIRNGTAKDFVPDLEINFIAEGTHFVQEQFPEKVNKLIINFINNHI